MWNLSDHYALNGSLPSYLSNGLEGLEGWVTSLAAHGVYIKVDSIACSWIDSSEFPWKNVNTKKFCDTTREILLN